MEESSLDAFKMSHNFLKEVMEHTSDAIVALDANWNYTYVNEKAAKLFGRTREQLVGKNIWKEFPEGVGQDFYHSYYESVKKNIPMEIESYYPPWDRWFENRIQPFQGGLLILFHDITDRKNKELQLLRMNTLLTASQQIGKMGTWVWNIKEKDGWLSVTMYELLGYFNVTEQITLKDFIAKAHPEDKHRLEALIRQKLKKPKDFCTEFRMFDKAGNVKYFRTEAKLYYDHFGNPEKLIGIILDITESELDKNRIREFNSELSLRVEQRTRELERIKSSLTALIENTNDGIWAVDNEKKITVFNSSFHKSYKLLTGRKLKEGLSLEEILDPISMRNQYEYWDKLISRALRGDSFSHEYNIQLRNRKLTYLISCHPIAHGEHITGATFFSKDITSRIKAEKEILKLNDHLSIKLEELRNINDDLNAFAYSVSHDLRSPLRAINGYSEMLKKHLSSTISEEDKMLFGRIIFNASKMDNLIQDLLSFSRFSKKEVSRDQINMTNLVMSVAREVLDDLGIQDHSIIRVHDMPTAYADYTLISQVYYNLFSNAVKFSSTKEAIRIEAGSVSENNRDVFYVKDNGIGFDMKNAEKIFNVFQRLNSDAEFEGTGIGLAIVKRIITKHEGTIHVKSKPGEGSTFYFTLKNRV